MMFDPKKMPIDLALSGGGFRATIFHLGVVGFLSEHNLLGNVKTICSVSGGSILAAHLTTYWDEYVAERSFQTGASRLLKWMMETDVSGRVLTESKKRILSLRTLDSEKLVGEYESLLAQDTPQIRRWDDLEKRGFSAYPDLHIVATHLNTGQMGAFSKNGFTLATPTAGAKFEQEINGFVAFAKSKNADVKSQGLSRATAASSAFPPVFSPISLVDKSNDMSYLLTDGGVYDNSGAKWLEFLYRNAPGAFKSPRIVLVSDAGREFPVKLQDTYDTFMDLAVRVTDTQANRILESDAKQVEQFFENAGVDYARISIHDNLNTGDELPEWHSSKVQQLLGSIRTELDCFSSGEVQALYSQGYLAARKAIRTLGPSDFEIKSLPSWVPQQRYENATSLEASLEDSSRTSKTERIGKMSWWLWLWLSVNRSRTIIFVLGLLAFFVCTVWIFTRLTQPTFRTPIGKLIVENLDDQNWFTRIPSVSTITGINSRSHVVAFETNKMGVLTQQLNHEKAVVHLALTGTPSEFSVLLFLKVSNNGETRYTLLEESGPQQLQIPSGNPDDRVVGLIISESPLGDLPWINSKLSIEFRGLK